MKIKLVLSLCLFFFVLITAFSQQKKYIYYLDENLNLCDKSKASFIGKGNLEAGKIILNCYDNLTNNLVLTASFKDSLLQIMDGSFKSYFQDKKPENEGTYSNNVMQGLWQKWNDKGFKTDSIIYDKGIKIAYAKFAWHENANIYSYSFTDSLKDTFVEKYFSSLKPGQVVFDVRFVGNKGLLKVYDSTGVKIDSVFNRDETEASFPGGDAAWRNYLMKHMNPDVLVEHNAPSGTYTEIVKFVVNVDGTLANIEAENKVGYGVEQEAIRIIKNSPNWIPAVQFGKVVKAYRRQPITFMIEGGK